MRNPLVSVMAGLAIFTPVLLLCSCKKSTTDSFERAMTTGRGAYEKGDATNAISAYSQAVKLVPESIDAHLNLANAYLLANEPEAVIDQSKQVLALDHNQAAAYYLMGCAYQRLNQPQPAIQAFQESQKIDPAVDALNFQLGLAYERAGHLDEAIREFETLEQFEPDHPSVHYQLSRLYQRTGRAAEATQELAKHQQLLAKNPNPQLSPAALERCKYTQPRVAFTLDQPDARGIPVHFADATAAAFGASAANYHGPIGVVDFNHDGRNSLFVLDQNGFRFLNNSNAVFTPLGESVPTATNGPYSACLVGDLNNDRFEDVAVLGEQGSHIFRFATNGAFREVTISAGLKDLKAKGGALADLDITGKLDLLTVAPGGAGLRVYRNLGSFYFIDYTTNSGLPQVLNSCEHVAIEDWQNEDVPGVFVTRKGEPPVFFAKQRAGAFVQTNLAASLPPADFAAFTDFNNDLLMDLALVRQDAVTVIFAGKGDQQRLSLGGVQPKGLLLVDYDNDGWMDIVVYGSGIRVWRNAGKAGFQDVTAALGLDKAGATDWLAPADFDNDGDTDLIAATPTGLKFWRNDGGNANKQLKLQLLGNRSNASALGSRVELMAGHWRTERTLSRLPFEVGVGKHDKIDLIQTRWSDLTATLLDVPVQPQPLTLVELVVPSGSCPYLYAWDGKRFRFVTDILGAAPLGLPVSNHHLVEQDPEEYLELGSETAFPARNGKFEIRITEELREVLYLDHAKLVAVDHPPGTIVVPTSKMRAKGPFPPHELWTLRPIAQIQKAVRSDGLDVTDALRAMDQNLVHPVRLREPQLRGLAEPFSFTMDFGGIPSNRSLVLVMNGWIRFGGGMANIAGSLDPNLPFPFPTLEAELPDGAWKRVDVDFGVPAGKTKTILVDLENKLPSGTRRLRLTTAFELYWDWAVLCEKVAPSLSSISSVSPARADLHWRGFSEFALLPDWLPLTPQYEKVLSTPPWSRTPSGWCTRYGAVDELIAAKDNAMALLNGGDEISLSFEANKFPAKPADAQRDFFLYVVGWDKDADFHVAQGWRVEPLPFLGMDDQSYATLCRPMTLDDKWISKYNTRWVGPLVLRAPSP
jgi:Flp pilus assembly protein TadD